MTFPNQNTCSRFIFALVSLALPKDSSVGLGAPKFLYVKPCLYFITPWTRLLEVTCLASRLPDTKSHSTGVQTRLGAPNRLQVQDIGDQEPRDAKRSFFSVGIVLGEV